MDSNLTHRDGFPVDLLSSTELVDFTHLIVGTLVPNFFLTCFGKRLAHGDLADDNVMAKLTYIGFGHELWVNIAKDALNKLDDVLNIMEDIKPIDNTKKYFNPS
jgi:hypothetical protein